MARKKSSAKPAPPRAPEIFAAQLGAHGSVAKGNQITEAEAVNRRKSGLDVVVCGSDLNGNRSLAEKIETAASGKAKRCPPHASAGRSALPHYQPGPRPGTLSMKRQIEKPSDSAMRYFTPELYLRFNSPDAKTADEANQAWEDAIAHYRTHLSTILANAPPGTSTLAELCLHDAELMERRDIEPAPSLPGPLALTFLSLIRDNKVISLVYFRPGEVHEHAAVPGWPFSRERKHWLYDELDSGPADGFIHRVLLSDGRVLEIPFVSVLIHGFDLRAETAVA